MQRLKDAKDRLPKPNMQRIKNAKDNVKNRLPKIRMPRRRRARREAAILLLQRYGFSGRPGENSWPKLDISFDTQEDVSVLSGAKLHCTIVRNNGSPPLEWKVNKRLVDFREDLYDPVRRELGRAKYAFFFTKKRVRFPLSRKNRKLQNIMSCLPWFTLSQTDKDDIASQMAEWCRVLASVVSFQDVQPQVALVVLHFLDTPVSEMLAPGSPFAGSPLQIALHENDLESGTGSWHTAPSGDITNSAFFESFSSRSDIESSSSDEDDVTSWGETDIEVITGPHPSESWPPPKSIQAWAHGDYETMYVRDLDYTKLKKKTPSVAPMYQVAGVHVLKGEQVRNAVKHLQPPPKVMDAKLLVSTGTWTLPLPRVVVWNLQVPYEGFSKDSEGCSIVVWGVVTDETVRLAQDLDNAPPSIRLWASYLKDTQERADASNVSHLVKGIAFSENFKELSLPWMINRLIESYNSKPVLVNAATEKLLDEPQDKLESTPAATPEWVELSTDGRDFTPMSRKICSSMLGKSPQAQCNLGILIQGVENDELPEQLLMCFRMAHLELCQ